MENTSGYALSGAGTALVLLLVLIPIVLWIVTLVSIVRSPNWTPGLKALWALAALPSGLVGIICWFVWGRNDGNTGPAAPFPPSTEPWPQQRTQFPPEGPTPQWPTTPGTTPQA